MPFRTIVALAVALGVASSLSASSTQPAGSNIQRSTIVVLGVAHSAQLVAPTYQPAVFRAFFNRVKPAAICVERPPDEYARRNYYEFTYEAQGIAIPYGHERGIPIFPIDWMPAMDDSMLVWGVGDIERPGFTRNPEGFHGFFHFDDRDDLTRSLFFAESPSEKSRFDEWYDSKRAVGERDFPRRLGLYRTFMQAMRIKRVAEQFPGKTILVVIGEYHKGDIEQILGESATIAFRQPSTFGMPSAEEIASETSASDLAAIATFNVLGLQSQHGVNWDWVQQALENLRGKISAAEWSLIKTRLEVLHTAKSPAEAIAAYRAVYEEAGTQARFTFDGVGDRRRIDSYFDPFGNLTVRQRALVEIAREQHQSQDNAAAEKTKEKLIDSGLEPYQVAELNAYWTTYVMKMK